MKLCRDVWGAARRSYSMWSIYLGLVCLIPAECALGVPADRDGIPIRFGWAALVFLIAGPVSAGSFDQKRSGAIARLVFPGAFGLWRGDVGLSLGGPWPRIFSIYRANIGTALELTNRRQARRAGYLGQASHRAGEAERLDPGGLIRIGPRLAIGDFLEIAVPYVGQMVRAARWPHTAMSFGVGRSAWRDKRGLKPGDAIPRRIATPCSRVS